MATYNIELLYNKKHKCGRSVVENTFSILEKTYWKLIGKFDLHVTFLPDVFTCFYLLHNLLCNQGYVKIETLMHIF